MHRRSHVQIPAFRLWSQGWIPDNYHINSAKAFEPPTFSQISNSLGHSKNFYTVITMVSILTLEFGREMETQRSSLKLSMTYGNKHRSWETETLTPGSPFSTDCVTWDHFLYLRGHQECLRNGMISPLPEGMGWTRWLPKLSASGKTVIYKKSQSCRSLRTEFSWSGLVFWKYSSYNPPFFSNIIFGT